MDHLPFTGTGSLSSLRQVPCWWQGFSASAKTKPPNHRWAPSVFAIPWRPGTHPKELPKQKSGNSPTIVLGCYDSCLSWIFEGQGVSSDKFPSPTRAIINTSILSSANDIYIYMAVSSQTTLWVVLLWLHDKSPQNGQKRHRDEAFGPQKESGLRRIDRVAGGF